MQDEVRTGHRLEILNQAFKGLLAINGGGAVALLAYLQAIEGNTQLVKVVLSGISAFSVGLVLAILFMLFRDRVSRADQFRRPSVKVLKCFEELFLYGSLLAFVAAVVKLVQGHYASLEN